MEFKVGQKYEIVDASKMWDRTKYNKFGNDLIDGETLKFSNNEVVTIVECPFNFEEDLCLFSEGYSQPIKALMNNEFHDYHPIDEYLRLIEDIPSEESEPDSTIISIYHIADVLEDRMNDYNVMGCVVLQGSEVRSMIDSLRKGGY